MLPTRITSVGGWETASVEDLDYCGVFYLRQSNTLNILEVFHLI